MSTLVNLVVNESVDVAVNDNYQLQISLEVNMKADAGRRQQKHLDRYNKHLNFSETSIGKPFTQSAASKFTEAVDAFINKPVGKGGRANRAAAMLKATGLDAATISWLFTKACYNQLGLTHRRRAKRPSFCIRTADIIHDEWRIQHFAQLKERRNLLKKLFKDFDKRAYPRHTRKATIRRYFDAEQIEWSGWTTAEKLQIGWALTVLFRDATALIKADRADQYVDPRPELVDAIQEMMGNRVLDFLIYSPMVCKPVAWSSENLFRGGYLSQNVRKYPLIKGTRKRDIARILSMDLGQILPAVNALQETPWRVNAAVLDVLNWAVNTRRGDIANLPPMEKLTPPEPPHDFDTNEEARKAYALQCFEVHNEERQLVGRRLMVGETLIAATAYEKYEEIFFPHNLDSRGRAYPLPAFLNPQGPDYTKALLEFAKGKPIDNDEQACWLAIAGANAYGNDKVSLQERADWVVDNEEMIFDIAANPKEDLRWTTASEPFQFLRFCFEWRTYREQGNGYVCHMPCPVDATCSGLQHYSAMLRDEVGGRSVNLVPGLDRQDIYGDVATRVIAKLTADLAKADVYLDEAKTVTLAQCSRDWLDFGINRKITKRQVMVVPYAGTFSSCMEYTRNAVAERVKDGYPLAFSLKDPTATDRNTYLARLIWEAIDEVVLKGKEAMRWLTSAASAYAKFTNKNTDENSSAFERRMSWRTPDGFEVVHYKPQEKQKQVETYLDGGVRLKLTYYEPLNLLDSKAMSQSLAPNFVHSLDATLLRMAVMKALSRGMTDFAMVHDSFGVHPSDMPVFLEKCVKPAFVEMYTNDPLKAFADNLPKELKLEALPTHGNLVLEDVVASEFFFS